MINITSVSAICNLGDNIDEIFKKACNGVFIPHVIKSDLPQISAPQYNLRCNRILLHLMNQMKNDIDRIIQKYSKSRIGVVIATTNSGIDEYEVTKNIEHLKISNPAEFIKEHLDLKNYAACVSTACTSGIKAFSVARKLLDNSICDSVIVGGVDPIAKLPVAGFSALEVLTKERTNPFSINRKGMNIGEGGALFILEKDTEGIKLLGIGETSDAYNAATPDPSGEQAKNAIKYALKEANLKPENIDYINLHATGTMANDIMEANAIYKIFKDTVPCSGTKPLTGHCLGASASLEVALCIKVLETGFILPHIYDEEYDSTIPKIKLVEKNKIKSDKIDICMCNAFGFGGTNAVIILGK